MPSIESGGVEKNLFIISNYLCENFKNVSIITADKNKIISKNKKILVYGPSSNFLIPKNRIFKIARIDNMFRYIIVYCTS